MSRYQTTAGALLAGGECTAGTNGGCASKLTTRPAVPEPMVRAADARFAARPSATAGMSGGECTAGSPGGASKHTRPAVPETSVGPGRAPVPGPTEHQGRGGAR